MIQKIHEIVEAWFASLLAMVTDLLALAAYSHIALTAVDPARNVRRAYCITRDRDLFEWHMVSWSWGRIGRKPLARARAFQTEREATAFVRTLLRRRATAPARLGVGYAVQASVAPCPQDNSKT